MSRNSSDTQISKTFSYILRHGAEIEGIQVTPGRLFLILKS
jgi:RNA:NAD 2'-phosphotransferase (TPT1/KptA family)